VRKSYAFVGKEIRIVVQAGVCDSFLFLASCVKIQFVPSRTTKRFNCVQNRKAKRNRPGRFGVDSWQLSVQIDIHENIPAAVGALLQTMNWSKRYGNRSTMLP
jgi:hypothetical protein